MVIIKRMARKNRGDKCGLGSGGSKRKIGQISQVYSGKPQLHEAVLITISRT